MAMHTRSTQVLTAAGYKTGTAHRTIKKDTVTSNLGRDQITAAVKLLEEALTHEGLVRIYAPLEGAAGARPRFSLGEAGTVLKEQLQAAIERAKVAEAGDTSADEQLAAATLALGEATTQMEVALRLLREASVALRK